MTKIICSTCGKSLQLDETKLPMKEVKFSCPHCKSTLSFQRQAPPAEVLPPVHQESILPAVPDGGTFHPSCAFVIGGEVHGLNEEVKALGFNVQRYASAQDAREHFYSESPQLVILVPAQLSMPPLKEMLPLTQIVCKDRRQSLFVLAAEGLRTMDGNAAFLYQVDMVVALKDIGSLHRIYREARQFQQSLYRHFRNFQEATD